jgi:type I restriction enzyme M protein
LDDFTIFNIVQMMQGYSLVRTTENIQGADIKGTVYEQMVGTTFRGELAQYFTPREIVDFIVEVIEPDKECKILDPACGSGGFLIMTLRKLQTWIKKEQPNLSDADIKAEIKYFAEHKVFGIDISDRMVRVAKMNMIMHGDGHAGIFHILRGGGLLTDPNLPLKLKEELEDGTLDVVFSNPPFAGHETDPAILEKFELGKNKTEKTINVSKEVLFIEKIIKLLRNGGKAGLVLPAGVFNNSSMKRVRDYIKTHVKILALVGLPHLAFQVSGANNEGHLLFIQKVDKLPSDYNIFIDWASDVGFDILAKKKRSDLSDILGRFHSPTTENIIKFSALEDRIDPWYYHPKYTLLKKELSKGGIPWRRMGDIFQPSTALFDPESYHNKSIKYVEKENVDMEKGIISTFSEHTLGTLPSWAKYVLKEGDVLFPRARDSMWGVTIVPKEFEGYIGSGGLIVLRNNPEEILLEYVRPHFMKPEILALIKRSCSGEINPKFTWKIFSDIEVPLPPIEEQKHILAEIDKFSKRKADLIKELIQLDHKISEHVSVAVPKVIENYGDIKVMGAEFIGSARLIPNNKRNSR